ncbi:putative Phosphate import ATP-binding protein pstB 1 [Xenorhabdus poinarii G6]|uniref:Putative Phosphate import ATP-binding protein pstB 1 n=1 Tax=Xenorhabdus poinarii G6 TaxID=1354304 RepID=A0A068R4V3_9GAMM|nr:ABC transporter ATP-binding protein [Xenorhabdus poinarii]CDG21951.1 putative Phosphate import ATP-binding protein pstB 1 [Xenorhabdus poinarii G6]
MIKLSNICKKYSGRFIIKDACFTFPNNGIYFLEGENGSGKSTLLGIIAGAIQPDYGDVFINGGCCWRKNFIAYAPDSPCIYEFITGKEFLDLICSIRKVEIEKQFDLVDGFNLHNYMYTHFRDMSLGTAKKFMLISAMIANVKILIFDEPTNGLDNDSLLYFIENIKNFSLSGLVIMTCHNFEVRKYLKPYVININIFKGD